MSIADDIIKKYRENPEQYSSQSVADKIIARYKQEHPSEVDKKNQAAEQANRAIQEQQAYQERVQKRSEGNIFQKIGAFASGLRVSLGANQGKTVLPVIENAPQQYRDLQEQQVLQENYQSRVVGRGTQAVIDITRNIPGLVKYGVQNPFPVLKEARDIFTGETDVTRATEKMPEEKISLLNRLAKGEITQQQYDEQIAPIEEARRKLLETQYQTTPERVQAEKEKRQSEVAASSIEGPGRVSIKHVVGAGERAVASFIRGQVTKGTEKQIAKEIVNTFKDEGEKAASELYQKIISPEIFEQATKDSFKPRQLGEVPAEMEAPVIPEEITPRTLKPGELAPTVKRIEEQTGKLTPSEALAVKADLESGLSEEAIVRKLTTPEPPKVGTPKIEASIQLPKEDLKQPLGKLTGNERKTTITSDIFKPRTYSEKPIKGTIEYGNFPENGNEAKIVNDWVERIKKGERPPILVGKSTSGKLMVSDGNHRLNAYKKLGINDIPVIEKKAGILDTITPKSPSPIQTDLLSEAKKYKSAEEFVKDYSYAVDPFNAEFIKPGGNFKNIIKNKRSFNLSDLISENAPKQYKEISNVPVEFVGNGIKIGSSKPFGRGSSLGMVQVENGRPVIYLSDSLIGNEKELRKTISHEIEHALTASKNPAFFESAKSEISAESNLLKRDVSKSQLTDIWNKANAEKLAKQGEAKAIKAEVTAKQVEPELTKSKFAQRLNDELPDNLKIDDEYDVAHLKGETDKAAKLIETDTKKALQVALGKEGSNANTQTATSIMLAEKAKQAGDWETVAQLYNNRRISNTRRGQEIAMEKLSIKMNPEETYMKEVVNARLNGVKLGTADIAEALTKKSKGERVLNKVKKDTEILKKELTKAVKIERAQKIFNDLICK